MRKNEFTSVEQFKAQYIGIWGPSDNHWLGLDFIYHGIEYRFNTGSMYSSRNTILPEGKEALFGLYRKETDTNKRGSYILLEEFATIDDALNSCCIEATPSREIIAAEETELVGQD